MNAKSERGRTNPAHVTKSIFIVEDHPIFREGLAQLVRSENGLSICGSAGTGAQALKAIGRLQPDLVLVDISLPDKNGLELIKAWRAAKRKFKILAISMHDEALYADRVLRAGGDGYIMKQEDPTEVIHAIHDVLNGHIYVSERVLLAPAKPRSRHHRAKRGSRLDCLSDLQLEVLECLGQGKSNEEIAAQLELSGKRVAAELAEIRKRLKLKTINALIRFAVCWIEAGAA